MTRTPALSLKQRRVVAERWLHGKERIEKIASDCGISTVTVRKYAKEYIDTVNDEPHGRDLTVAEHQLLGQQIKRIKKLLFYKVLEAYYYPGAPEIERKIAKDALQLLKRFVALQGNLEDMMLKEHPSAFKDDPYNAFTKVYFGEGSTYTTCLCPEDDPYPGYGE